MNDPERLMGLMTPEEWWKMFGEDTVREAREAIAARGESEPLDPRRGIALMKYHRALAQSQIDPREIRHAGE